MVSIKNIFFVSLAVLLLLFAGCVKQEQLNPNEVVTDVSSEGGATQEVPEQVGSELVTDSAESDVEIGELI